MSEITQLKERIIAIENTLENKVSFKVFTWVLGVLMTITLSIFGFIYSKLNTVETGVNITKEDVATIKGKLEPYEIEFKK